MNDSLLKYYKVLQPFFRERMGEWRIGDIYYNSELDFLSPVDNLHAIRNVAGQMPNYLKNLNNCRHVKSILWIPRTIDDFSEEARKRSLIGMLQNVWTIYPVKRRKSVLVRINSHTKSHYEAPTLTEALLKALCAQQGVEVGDAD
jgi:hypothetical protein